MNYGTGDYILTESHPSRGFQGMLIEREAYLKVPHYDRALFEIINEDSEQWYYCRLTVREALKESHYLLLDTTNVEAILCQLHIQHCAYAVIKELSRKNNITLTCNSTEYSFSLIKSK